MMSNLNLYQVKSFHKVTCAGSIVRYYLHVFIAGCEVRVAPKSCVTNVMVNHHVARILLIHRVETRVHLLANVWSCDQTSVIFPKCPCSRMSSLRVFSLLQISNRLQPWPLPSFCWSEYQSGLCTNVTLWPAIVRSG